MSTQPLSYRAGAASVCITPDEPLWLAGFAARTAPARGKISNLYASALALEDVAGLRFVIASMDIIAITPVISDQVIEAAYERHGLSRRQILLTATHTHYGPEFRPDKQVFFNIPAEYADKLLPTAKQLASSLTRVIDQALARLEPARLFVRKTTAGFSHNRRRHGVKDGRPSTEDVLDHDVPVLDCVDAAGRRKAIVFGYACHNTTIPPDDLRYCGDWAGFAKEQLQRTNPGATAFFIPGAGADQDPEPSGSAHLSRQHGREMADAVQQSLDAQGIEIAGPIRAEWKDVQLALEPMTPESIGKMVMSADPPQQMKGLFLFDRLKHGKELITSYAAPIQVVRFGNELLLIALSGEPVVDWAHKFKREFEQEARSQPEGARQGVGTLTPHSPLLTPHFPLVWVAGYCNDMFGYVPTRRVQAEGGYEAGRASLWSSIPAPFTDDVEDRITEAVRRLAGKLGAGD